jgi:hypothetical protein
MMKPEPMISKAVRKSPEFRKEARTESSSKPPETADPANTVILYF